MYRRILQSAANLIAIVLLAGGAAAVTGALAGSEPVAPTANGVLDPDHTSWDTVDPDHTPWD